MLALRAFVRPLQPHCKLGGTKPTVLPPETPLPVRRKQILDDTNSTAVYLSRYLQSSTVLLFLIKSSHTYFNVI